MPNEATDAAQQAATERAKNRERTRVQQQKQRPQDPCIRAENEDDDGYDPYSDRRPDPEPLFEADPWR